MIPIQLCPGDALLIIDPQIDFFPGGALPVADADTIIPLLNDYIALFRQRTLPVFATRDWHPSNHISFQAQGGPWPPHCIAGTPGAAFSPELELGAETIIISKAQTPQQDAYSGFEHTDLEAQLRKHHIHRLFIGGLATDFCVLNTVRDALRAEFNVFLLQDAIRAIELHPGNGAHAINAMEKLGAQTIRLEQIEPHNPFQPI